MVDTATFQSAYSNIKKRLVTKCEYKNSVDRLEVWAYVDTALNIDELNGRSSTGFIVMVGNTSIILKA